MPWAVSDVEGKIKGLSPSQKARWVGIANNARKDCIKSGKIEKYCDGYAIRIAN